MSNKITVLYLRTSTKGQTGGYESQYKALLDYCKSNKITKYRVFGDEGISGAKSRRPGLDEMIELVDEGKVEAVLVYSFSRMARSTIHLLKLLEKFQETNTNFISITEQIQGDSPMGRAFFTVCAAMSQLERELIVERVTNGLQNAKAKGVRLGAKKKRNSPLIRELLATGLYTQTKIGQITGVSRSAVYREIQAMKLEEGEGE
jgi:DNA invertase Pin-like site-specific DNA recombinase